MHFQMWLICVNKDERTNERILWMNEWMNEAQSHVIRLIYYWLIWPFYDSGSSTALEFFIFTFFCYKIVVVLSAWLQVFGLGSVFKVSSSGQRQQSSAGCGEVAMCSVPGPELSCHRRPLSTTRPVLSKDLVLRRLCRVLAVQMSSDAGNQLHAEYSSERLVSAELEAKSSRLSHRSTDTDAVRSLYNSQADRPDLPSSTVRSSGSVRRTEANDSTRRIRATASVCVQAYAVQHPTRPCTRHDMRWHRQ